MANRLVSARYAMTAIENHIVNAVIGKINADDEDFKDIEITVVEVAKSGKMSEKSKNTYEYVKEAASRVRQRTLRIQEEDGLLETSWFSSVKYYEGKGKMRFRFDPALKPYLLGLKQQFTTYFDRDLKGAKCSASFRFYGLIMEFSGSGRMTKKYYDLPELIATITEGGYERFYNFQKRVLDPAQKELKVLPHTRKYFDYEIVREGRKAVGLWIYAREKEPENLQMRLSAGEISEAEIVGKISPKTRELLAYYGVRLKDRDLAGLSEDDVLKSLNEGLEWVKRREKFGDPVRNVPAALATAIRKGFGKQTEFEKEAKGRAEEKHARQAALSKKRKDVETLVQRVKDDHWKFLNATIQATFKGLSKKEKTAILEKTQTRGAKFGPKVQKAIGAQDWENSLALSSRNLVMLEGPLKDETELTDISAFCEARKVEYGQEKEIFQSVLDALKN